MEQNYLEISGRTVDEAIEKALEQLGATRDEVEITVIRKGRAGILGLGTEEALVGVQRVRQPGVEEPTAPPAAAKDEAAHVTSEVVEGLLRLIGLQASVTLVPPATEEDPLAVDVRGDDLGVLIGRRGQALSSFQFIVRLMVSHRLQSWVPLTVDVEGYKRRRMESLRNLALRLADQVKRTRRSMTLEPMPPDERRAVHLALAQDPDVTTESTGEGEERKVAIVLKRE